MPILKIFADEAIGFEGTSKLVATLPSLRNLLCRGFDVDISICQCTVIPVHGLRDQALLAVEIQILPKPERTREMIIGVCNRLREALLEAVQEKAAVRVTTLDPATYVVVR